MSEKVRVAAHVAINGGMVGKHCWNWIYKVFEKAGLIDASKKFNENFEYVFRGAQYVSAGKLAGASKFLPRDRYGEIQEGDWLYVHNKNKYDAKGNHSVIFLSWTDSDRRVAQTASAPFGGKPGRFETRDLVEQPIAWVMRAKGG